MDGEKEGREVGGEAGVVEGRRGRKGGELRGRALVRERSRRVRTRLLASRFRFWSSRFSVNDLKASPVSLSGF